MRPTPIPDDEIMPGHIRLVVGPPVGADPTGTIRAVEMLATTHVLDGRIYRARIVLEPGELERLAAGEPFWLSLWGHVVPFDLAMTDPDTEEC